MKNRLWFLLPVVLAAVLLAEGCAPSTSPATQQPDAPASTTQDQTPKATAVTAVKFEYKALFTESTPCAACHSGIKDGKGNDVTFNTAWAPSMHANSARDPYFLATVRGEVEQHKELDEVIQDTCATCHLPMARVTAGEAEAPAQIFDNGFMNPSHELHKIGIDGISCSFCHQIQAANLGKPESFSGAYQIDNKTAMGERQIFGPFKPDDASIQLMKAAAGFTPTQSDHMGKPEFCATCHTLYTPTVDKNGKVLDKTFPEQTVYLEWQNSSFIGMTCQACHMPPASGDVQIASVGGQPRSPVFQHTFLGPNSYMIDLLGANHKDLQTAASADDFNAASQRSQDFMKQMAGSVDVTATKDGDKLNIEVKVSSRAGHKLPSGFPSRRAWLHLTVTDASGKVVFESGQYEPTGKITENDNDQDAAKFEPHYDTINDAKQVQIYEAILGNTEGAVTTELLRAGAYIKDNRLLPSGFDPAKAGADTAVAGNANKDATFTGGGDTVTYQVNTTGMQGPFQVSAQFLFQTVGYRWAESVRGEKTAESEAFAKNSATTPPLPVMIAEAKTEAN